MPCQSDKYFKDEWKDWNCVRLEGANGFVEEYYEEQKCHGFVIVPGTSLLSPGILGVGYLIALLFVFLGIGIISDIFMESIEVITSQTK